MEDICKYRLPYIMVARLNATALFSYLKIGSGGNVPAKVILR
jgi:hypothetical protein